MEPVERVDTKFKSRQTQIVDTKENEKMEFYKIHITHILIALIFAVMLYEMHTYTVTNLTLDDIQFFALCGFESITVITNAYWLINTHITPTEITTTAPENQPNKPEGT